MRVTETMLREQVERIKGYYPDISIKWAYGQPRVYNANKSQTLSPRLPTGHTNIWLHGFEAGFELGYEQPKGGTIHIEIRNGALVDVEGLPPGWLYELCNWDVCSECGGLDPNCEWHIK